MHACLACLLILIARAQTPARANDAPPPALVEQVVRDLEPKNMVRITDDVAGAIEARAVDLDGDGRPEWLIAVRHPLWCGRRGGYCPLAVYAGNGDAYRRLFPSRGDDTRAPTALGVAGLAGVHAGPHRTAGLLDLTWHFDSGEEDPAGPYDVTLTYDGTAYAYRITRPVR